MLKHSESPSREEFARWVRSALRQLYDSPSLERHPLAHLLADQENDALDRAQNLRRLLLEALRTMRPAASVPAHSPDWRGYRILELRYVEGLSPDEAMKQLALRKSQYFRDQSRALQVVTGHLWNHYEQARPRAPQRRDLADTAQENLVRRETERLLAQATWEQVNGSQLLDELRAVVAPLASAKGTSVRIVTSCPLQIAHASRVLLRQAILNAITYGLEISGGGRVEISSYAGSQETGIRIRAWAPEGLASPSRTYQSQGVRLDVSRRLMAAMGGSLQLEARSANHWEARLVWRASAPRTLLVIDDNRGFVDLFRRYLAGHNWRVVGVPDGARARQMIAKDRPSVITLDVLMPQEDGWELLMALKTSHDTRDIPVIVCSVLEESQLALSLGAAAYLPKPVTEQSLLRTLAAWS